MRGPYFSGQQPSSCGHYYPDVLRLRDEKRQDGTFVRIMDCTYCGRYELQLDVRTLSKALIRKLNKKGFDVGTREDELSEVRGKELEKFSTGDYDKERGLQMLQSLLEEAIDGGADAIELEYVAEGLEVTFMVGSSGIGSVVDDRMLAAAIIGLIVERAKLQNKSRGVIDWAYRGKSYKITVVEYESFGESAFKLLLQRPGRKRA
ncbi:MAG TPA: hypothetical protein VJ124_02045 [Pyrinomonadaceae bacterium]|nr:hypothetical protein [Pyrinomonadaceae bacterium]